MGFQILVNGHHNNRDLRPNDKSKPWVVQKFGGTSVGKFPDQIAETIVRGSLVDSRVAVVCSARSNNTKAEGTTNRLLRAAREAEGSGAQRFTETVNIIKNDHIDAARSCIQRAEIFQTVSGAVLQVCQDLSEFLAAAQRIGEISPKSLDKVISKGEILSAVFIAALLQDRGLDSQVIDLSEVVSSGSHRVLDRDFYAQLAVDIASRLKNCGEKVPVITGFFGVVPGGLLDQIGRGYTDLCAALVAIGLQAKELQIWKEVDGIFTADPRKVPTATLLPTITPAEVAELTFYGSEVIHPFTMEQVIRARIPIRIKNVMNPRGSGTIILPEAIDGLRSVMPGHELKLVRTRGVSLSLEDQHPKRPTAITIKPQILVMNVHSNKESFSHDFLANLFITLRKWRLSVDLISISQIHVSMAMHSESPLVTGDGEDDEKEIVSDQLRGAVTELKEYGTIDLKDGMAILSLVGRQMKNMNGIAGQMCTALGAHKINIDMISQGASEINISCVIQERHADRALNVLHTNLFTFLD